MDLGADTVSSPADLSFPDMSTEVSTEVESPVEESPESPAELTGDPEQEQPEAADETEAEPEEALDAQAEVEPEATAEDELPDGVRKGKDRNGKDVYFLKPQRYELFHKAHTTLRDLSNQIGQPLTKEVITDYQRAYEGNERLFADILSGDAQAQSKVLDYFLKEGARAHQEGEVGTDPIIPLAKTFYDTLQTQHPNAYAELRNKAAQDLVSELYGEAQRLKSKDLFMSAGWVAKALGFPYKKGGEMQPFFNSPAQPAESELQQRVRQLEAQLNGQAQNSQQSQFQQWKAQTGNVVRSSVLKDGVQAELGDVGKQGVWKDDPKAFTEYVVNPLNSAVTDAIGKDANFGAKIARLTDLAQRAVSAQKRAEYQGEIAQLYVNRARLAAEALKPQILRDAAKRMANGSAANHQRRAAATAVKAPAGGSAPKRPLAPNGVGNWEQGGHADLMNDLKGLFG